MKSMAKIIKPNAFHCQKVGFHIRISSDKKQTNKKHASQHNHQIPADLVCKNACVVNSSARKIAGDWDI